MGIITRSFGSFLFATALVRAIGRKSLAQFSYLDFITANFAGNMIGYFAAGQEKGPKLLLAPVVIIASTLAAEYTAVKNRTVRNLLEGKPVVLIQNGKILEATLKKSLYNINELLLSLRQRGIFDLQEIEYAILETNGKISVLKKSQNRPISPADLNLTTKYAGLASVLISDGDILQENLTRNNLDLAWLNQQLSRQGITDKNKVFLAVLASDHSLYIDLKNDKLPLA